MPTPKPPQISPVPFSEEEEFEFAAQAERDQQFSVKDVPGGGALSYMGDVLKNAPGSALRLAGGIASLPVTGPMFLGRAMYDVGKATMGDTGPLSETAGAIGGHFKQRYGSFDNAAETIRTDPVGFAADWLPVGGFGASRLGAAGVPGAAKAASFMSKADPTRLGLAVAESGLHGIGNRLERRALTTYEKATGFEPQGEVNPRRSAAEKSKAARAGLEAGLTISPVPSNISLTERATTGKTGTLTGDLWGNIQKLWGKSPATVNANSLRYLEPEVVNKSTHKMAILEAKANEEISSTVAELEGQGYNLSKAGREQLAQQAMDHVLKKVSATPEVLQAMQEMRDFEARTPLGHPDLPTDVMVSDIMTPKMIQQRKQTLRAGQGFGGSMLDSKITDTKLKEAFQKAMAHELMSKLEEWAPELKNLNETSAGRKLMMDALGQYVDKINQSSTLASKAWAVGRIGGAGVGGAAVGGGVGAATAVLAAFALGRPSVRTSLARAMYQSSKISERAAKKAGQFRLTTSSIPEAATAAQRYLIEPQRETSKSGRPIISNDGGKTWEYE